MLSTPTSGKPSLSSRILSASVASVLGLGLLAGIAGAVFLFVVLGREQTIRSTSLSEQIPKLALTSLVEGNYQPVASKLDVFRGANTFSYVSVADSRGGPVAAFGVHERTLLEVCSVDLDIRDENGMVWGFYTYCFNRWSVVKYAALTGIAFFLAILIFAFLLASRLSKKIQQQSQEFSRFLDRMRVQTDRLISGDGSDGRASAAPLNLVEERQIDSIFSGLIEELQSQIRRREAVAHSLVEAQARNTVSRRVAHDIKSPLSAIKIVSSMLPQGSQELALAQQAVARIEGVLGELSKSNTLQKGSVSWQDISNLVETIFSEKRTVYPQIRLQLKTDGLSGIDFRLLGDKVGIGRVISNVIQNSIEASDGNLILQVSMTSTGNGILISIRDNGSGFPEQLLATLGLGEITSKSRGQGIGLSSALEYMAAISGKLSARNCDSGAEVTIEFSRADGQGIEKIGRIGR